MDFIVVVDIIEEDQVVFFGFIYQMEFFFNMSVVVLLLVICCGFEVFFWIMVINFGVEQVEMELCFVIDDLIEFSVVDFFLMIDGDMLIWELDDFVLGSMEVIWFIL